MTKVDFGGLKQKLMNLDRRNLGDQGAGGVHDRRQNHDTTKLAWLVGIHMIFVISMLVLAIVDRLSPQPNEK